MHPTWERVIWPIPYELSMVHLEFLEYIHTVRNEIIGNKIMVGEPYVENIVKEKWALISLVIIKWWRYHDKTPHLSNI